MKNKHIHATRGTTEYSAREGSEQRQTDRSSQHQCNGSTNHVTASSWVKELFPNVSYLALRG